MKIVRCVLVVVALVVALTPSYSQFALSAGPALGLNFNLHGGSALPEAGSGLGMVIGGVADIQFNKSIGILASLYFYDVRSGSYSTTSSNVGYDIGASLAYFTIEPLFKFQMPSGLFLVGGFNIGFNLKGDGEATITTSGFTFSNGQTTQTSPFTNLNSRFEMKAGAGYEYPLSDGMVLAPMLTFGFGLSDVQSNVAWKISTFQLLVPLRFSLM